MAVTTIIFDTDCVLCSKWVHFILAHERDQGIMFVSAWSPHGLAVAARYGLNEAELQRTYLVVDDGLGLTRSDAGLALLRHLKPPYSWLRALRIVPRPVRDYVYVLVARNRYRWFGKVDRCFVPPEAMRHRFIDRP
ncbi:putative DCC family thiol-disulfide oxidoreductase YuxK [Sphingobium sp. B11D3B]|uniref:thiol-disulfide oxidoreductase DCC family protein n=1 Tax=Sphingobium sp. B11D3B TaxID=2940575 RepID=UPI002227A9C3|nr:DCC1-like thiol-disulfide oxidoreductase family protein [Sphingobium sp. B11D3B]MCW2389594.1 putative DCC family thiol-disulfide oxidoreductase YuxK [Sphingobium sp. B11D3B]